MGFFFFLPAPHMQPGADLGALKAEVQQILSLARRSQHRELMEFGQYVERLISQLFSALEGHQLAGNTQIVKDLEELHKTLYSISQRISNMGKPGDLMSFTRRIRFPDEDPVSQMRRQLNDALEVFKLGAFFSLLSNNSKPPTTSHTTGTLGPDPPYTYKPSLPLSHNQPGAQECSVPHTTHSVQHDRPFDSHCHNQPCKKEAKRIVKPSGLCADDGEIVTASMNVERCRRLLQQNHSPTQVMKLAAALSCLVASLAKAGRTLEALDASQESAELYKTLAPKGV